MPPKKASSSSSTRVIYWFRTDLRIHDSPALTAALDLKPEVFYPIWTWDPHYAYRARVGANRFKFLLECQSDLSASLQSLNKKQKLHVIREAPQTVFPKLFKKWKPTHLVFEKDTDAYARDRDNEVMKLAKEAGVEVVVKMGRTLFDPDEVVKNNGGKSTMSMNQLLSAASKINSGKPDRPLDAPTTLPDPGDMDLSDIDHEAPSAEPDFNANQRTGKKDKKTQYQSIMGPEGDFSPATLEELGIDPSSAQSPHKGGETEALKLLEQYVADEEWLASFQKPQSAPTDSEPASTTLLSPHHHFGSLSIRRFYWATQDLFAERKKKNKHVAGEPMNMIGQLLFRDMYFAAQAPLGHNYAQVQGNPIVRFIPWHLQSNHDSNGILDGTYKVDDPRAEEYFRRWKEGRTGFPWIDALMRQLRTEGWIHHLGRHAVACFLTRGGCYVHWERGADVFEEYLIDHEVACNVGNWMWLSCTAFFAQFYRMYSPISFPKKWDPNGDFVRKYVPELKNFDKKFIYEPSKAPIADQKKWGCRVTGDGTEKEADGIKAYPKPMFDFNERRSICLDGMKDGYDHKLYGNSKEVLNGSWKKTFGFDDSDAPVKDEGNGDIGAAQKRKVGSDEYESDLGEDADTGAQTDEEVKPPKKSAKKSKK